MDSTEEVIVAVRQLVANMSIGTNGAYTVRANDANALASALARFAAERKEEQTDQFNSCLHRALEMLTEEAFETQDHFDTCLPGRTVFLRAELEKTIKHGLLGFDVEAIARLAVQAMWALDAEMGEE